MNSALYRVVAATAALGSLAAHEPASAAPTQPEASSPQTNVTASPKAAVAIAPTPMAIAPDLPTVDFSSGDISNGISNGVSNSEPVSVAALPSVTNSNAVPSQLPPLPPVSSTPVASPQPTQPPAEPLPTVGVSPTPVLRNPAPTQTAVQPGTGTQYRVIVPAATAEMQQRVKTAVPDAFRTTVNGQTVMQVGLFREQNAAEEMKRSLERQNLQASILSVPQAVSPPSTPSPSTPSPSTPMLYRVIVPATSAQVEQRVKVIAPDAFRTTLNGQTVMQAGLFREQSTAANLQQSLTRQNLQASIVSTPAPSTPLPPTSSPATPMLYRVIVPASSAQVEQRVRAIAPGAFRTTLNGQTVMQAGLFREQSTAANLQQSLNRQNLQASIVPVSEASVNLPQTPPSGGSSGEVPKERIVVVIDPGHGGRDPGAIGIGGLRETDVVLSISRQVADLLEREGIQVIMTRPDERTLELSTRVQMAQRANADYFVSIHANALSMSRPDVNGVETFYHRSGRDLAQSIQNSIMQSVNMNNRGVKQANFYVLRNTSMPSVLVEVGFVTGRDDAAKLRDANFQTTMAGAIARGIVQNVRSR
jgi:N-acetylmuramoyl-L-alanine amidase